MGAEVFEFKKNKVFTMEEAEGLLPLVKRITREAVDQVTHLEQRLHEAEPDTGERVLFEDELNEIVQRWSDKINKLGATPKGFWLVDFDNGNGYLCWKYNENSLNYFHDYATGFSGRTPIN